MSTLFVRNRADLDACRAKAAECTHLEIVGLDLGVVPAFLGELAVVDLLRFDNCTITGFEPAVFTAGSVKGKVDVEFAYCTFDADALFEKALVHGLGTWRVQDYGSRYQRDPRWKTLSAIGEDGQGDEAFRKAAYAFAGKSMPSGKADEVHLRLLDHSKKPIREKVAIFLEEALPNLIAEGNVAAGAKVWVLGTPVSHDKDALKARLEALGFVAAKGVKDATAVLLLPKPGPKLAQALEAKLPILVEGHLKASAEAKAPAPAAPTQTESSNLDALFFNGDAKNQKLGLSLVKARALEGKLLAEAVAVAFFSTGADVRKEGRALLLSHAPDALRTRLQGDKRNYFSIDDGAKLTKLATELSGFGVDAAAFTMAMLRLFAGRPHPYGGTFEPALVAALVHNPGREEDVFEVLSGQKDVYLPFKKTFPKGLSRLRALEKLRIPHATVTSNKNVDELAKIPQSIAIEYWVKDTDLSHLLPAAENIHGLYFRGAYSNLSDIALLARFPKLAYVGLEETDVADLAPLAKLPLFYVNLNRTKVTSLEPLRGKATLAGLHLQNFVGDLAPVATLPNLTHLTLSFTNIQDLSLLASQTKLEVLDLWGCEVTDLSPLVGKPLQTLTLSYSGVTPKLAPLGDIPTLGSLSLIGVEVDEAELAALQAKLPNLYVSR